MSELLNDLRELAAFPVGYGQETHGELHTEALAYIELLRGVLARIVENAEAWHGPPPEDSGHPRALAVIARWGRDALADAGGDTKIESSDQGADGSAGSGGVDYERLSVFNAEVARGLVHTRAWRALMGAEQARFDREAAVRGMPSNEQVDQARHLGVRGDE